MAAGRSTRIIIGAKNDLPLPPSPASGGDRQLDTFLRTLFHDEVPPGLNWPDPDFFDLSLLRTSMSAMRLCQPDATDAAICATYLRRASTCLLNPNPLFDEAWYRTSYGDIDAAVRAGQFVSGFSHFVSHGLREGRWPNFTLRAAVVDQPASPVSALSPELYRQLNIGARTFLKAFNWLSELDHYNLFGRHLDYAIRADHRRSGLPGAIGAVLAEIDTAFYRERYLADDPDRDPADHYLNLGAALGHSPSRWFDEGWYRSFYVDVRRALRNGDVISGFHHYVLYGRGEGRRPRYDLRFALESRIPGVTVPALLDRLPHLRVRAAAPGRIVKVQDRPAAAAPTIWFLLPFLNADIAFGGYATVFALIKAVRRDGFGVGILCLEEERPNLEYFFWRQDDREFETCLSGCRILGRAELGAMAVRRDDLFVAYSVWDLKLAARLAAAAGGTPPFLLVQEYEPVFHDNGSLRTLCVELYAIPHVPIVNSRFLLDYLRRHRIGVFAGIPSGDGRHHLFEHHINRLPGQTARAMATRRDRLLVAYARPEAHAARNLFEIVVLALEQLCARGAFGPEWFFVGLGCLSDLPDIDLGGGHNMRLVPKMSREDYVAFMGSVDIGISLMSAPHPSVVPFELATTGALVVTNTYENRSAADLAAICANIVPCDESLSGVVAALAEAASRVDDFAERERRTYRPENPPWDRIFSPAMVREIFGRPVPAAAPRPPVPRSPSRTETIRRLAAPSRALASRSLVGRTPGNVDDAVSQEQSRSIKNMTNLNID
ncbi:MAG: hypothetical protein INR65_05040 [Gluconacetobacter diazotrophicus]|nr:hypothetical protein [Gluconacetobacter diazotrophicus]